VYVPDGFSGFKYWMAFTPYPKSDDRLENPSLRASQDGLHWVLPPGVPDPIVPPPPSPAHHADCDLVLKNGVMHLFYMTTNELHRATTFSVTTSAEGSDWSTPTVVYQGQFGVSPAVVAGDDCWLMWYVRYDSDKRGSASELLLRRGADAASWSEDERVCSVRIEGHVLWHIDVIRVNEGFEALLTAFPEGAGPWRSRLFHGASSDGIRWSLSQEQPILRPSVAGWDSRLIYRSTLLKADDSYRVWYSAASWTSEWGIGFLEGPICQLLETSASYPPGPSPSMWRDFLAMLIKSVAGVVRQHAPHRSYGEAG